MAKRFYLIGSGYTSMDRLIKINRPAEVGFTSLIVNNDHGKIYYGGCAANICYLLNKLEIPALPVMRVGSDWRENGYREYLSSAGVPLDAVRELPEEITGSSYIIENESGEHITLFHPGAMDGAYAEQLDARLFRESRYALMTVASKKDNELFFRQCRENDVPLILGMKMDTSAFPRAFLYELLVYSSILFTNESESEEIVRLFGLTSITDLFDLGNAELIITTMGTQGSRCYVKAPGGVEEKQVGVCPVDHPIEDFTGAGDAYIAGFLFGFFQEKTVEECCGLGSTCSSFIIEAMGCTTNAPDRESLQRRYTAWRGMENE